jgi:hypothetical protein
MWCYLGAILLKQRLCSIISALVMNFYCCPSERSSNDIMLHQRNFNCWIIVSWDALVWLDYLREYQWLCLIRSILIAASPSRVILEYFSFSFSIFVVLFIILAKWVFVFDSCNISPIFFWKHIGWFVLKVQSCFSSIVSWAIFYSCWCLSRQNI